jgi:hypothetical protein
MQSPNRTLLNKKRNLLSGIGQTAGGQANILQTGIFFYTHASKMRFS